MIMLYMYQMLCILPFVAYIFFCFLFLLSANSVSFSVYIYLHIYAYGQENPEPLFVDWIGWGIYLITHLEKAP